MVYDLAGRLIFEENNLNQKTEKLTIPERTGYYVVRVITDNSSFSRKVLISVN